MLVILHHLCPCNPDATVTLVLRRAGAAPLAGSALQEGYVRSRSTTVAKKPTSLRYRVLH